MIVIASPRNEGAAIQLDGLLRRYVRLPRCVWLNKTRGGDEWRESHRELKDSCPA
jgi:hypothetical protein